MRSGGGIRARFLAHAHGEHTFTFGGRRRRSEVALFLTIGLLVFPSQIPEVFVAGLVLALVVAFIARPLAAAVALAFPRYSVRERLVIGWAGLRGRVPAVLAVLAVVSGVPRSVEFFTVAFFAVVVSTLIHGITVTPWRGGSGWPVVRLSA